MQPLADLIGQQHAGHSADETENHVAEDIGLRNEQAADQGDKHGGKGGHRAAQQDPVEYRCERKWHDEKSKSIRDHPRIRQAHRQTNHHQVNHQATKNQHHAAVAAARTLKADLKKYNGCDRNDQAVERAFEGICRKGGARCISKNQQGAADRESGVKREFYPRAFFQCADDRVFAMNPALFS